MSYIKVTHATKPSPPPSGQMYLYAKDDNKFYLEGSDGTESPLGSTNTTMTNDPAWNAKGDLVVGSGDNSAVILSAGANRKLLMVNPSGALGVDWESLNAVNRMNITDAGSNAGLNFEAIPASWKRVVVEDEFLGGSATSLSIGKYNWWLGAGTITAKNSEANHPGIINLSSTGTANTIGRIALMPVTDYGTFVAPSEIESMTFILRPLTSFTTSGSLRCGYGDYTNATGDTAKGMYFSRLFSDTNWTAVTRDNSNITKKNTGVAYTANNWYLFEIKRDGTYWRFYINGNLVSINDTNVPTGITGRVIVNMETNTSTLTKTVDIDYISVVSSPYTQRWT